MLLDQFTDFMIVVLLACSWWPDVVQAVFGLPVPPTPTGRVLALVSVLLAAAALAADARGYTELIREHIRIEDEYFYKLADQLLTLAEQESVVAKFVGEAGVRPVERRPPPRDVRGPGAERGPLGRRLPGVGEAEDPAGADLDHDVRLSERYLHGRTREPGDAAGDEQLQAGPYRHGQ